MTPSAPFIFQESGKFYFPFRCCGSGAEEDRDPVIYVLDCFSDDGLLFFQGKKGYLSSGAEDEELVCAIPDLPVDEHFESIKINFAFCGKGDRHSYPGTL